MSSNVSDSTVGKELAKEDDAVSPGATPDASEAEHDGMSDDAEMMAPLADLAAPGVPEVVPVPVAPAEIPLPPAFAPGVELAEISPTSHAKCFGCGEKVLRGSVRFKYWTNLKLHRYLHSTCFDKVPPEHVAHSRLCLEYCCFWYLGEHESKVQDAIHAALAPP